MLEETGIVAELLGVAEVHDVIMRQADGTLEAHYILSVYYGVWVSGDVAAGSDAAAARFVSLNALADYKMTDGASAIIAMRSNTSC